DELVDRLLNAVSPREARRIAGRMTLYQATDAGQGLIDEYKAFQKQERKTAEGAAKEALLAGDYEQAALTISAYEAKQPFERGMWIGIGDTGSVWGPDRHPFRVSALQEMMTLRPWFLDGLTDDECAQIQIAAAMSVLCGERPARFGRGIQLTSPTRFEPKWLVNMQSSYALNRYTLRELQGVVGVVTTTTCNDQYVCASCKRMSERRFPLRQAPELPSPECTSETGCRCWYLPVID
ncbi:MAG TPA: hypothetical protein VM537_27325, partial [Anaerolineae bacterium]|nr:hypothetical protein [Anaerolineae bacterium]